MPSVFVEVSEMAITAGRKYVVCMQQLCIIWGGSDVYMPWLTS
ncbi:hypothetical protein SAMN05660653_01166 [Desulfonatronum thiosulfatophilum]|uniref:Uncharacterized protein n=1 Tax=Desulfonatronum thiosulfatophilum TaxID=617002 RepID=A0A1G6BW89_9BACT|nr:hypothetical protein SAMN05660653_01166 [Desulfonatronum thiosulfatophilum]